MGGMNAPSPESEAASNEDQRILLIRRLVGAEARAKEALMEAKESAARANKLSTEVENTRLELYRALGIEEPRSQYAEAERY